MKTRSVRSVAVQSHGTAHTVFAAAAAEAPVVVDSGDETACAPAVVRSTTFHPLPPQIGQSALAMAQQ
ncbi:MAG TPA: hypothetical protein VFW94_17540 [Candidatus Acidoferrales bacterium]|nr:hypothetical protein [Candidatus Acidoferrales bacterium]